MNIDPADALSASAESQPPEPAPFIGLKPYAEQDRYRFFGREQDTFVLVDKIRTHKLTLLVAASGVGKSSLLEAGVKPVLRQGGKRVLLSFGSWFGDPLPALKRMLTDDLVARGRLAPAQRPRLDRPLEELLRIHGLLSGEPLVLFLDQLEELFNYQRLTGRMDPLVQELAAAIRDRAAPTGFVFSMREDFAMELHAFEPYLTGIFDNYYRLEKLSTEQARAAIENPVHAVEFRYEGDRQQPSPLVDELLHDLSHREQRERLYVQDAATGRTAELRVEPPHLQLVCKALWELNAASPDRTISHASYRKAGGVYGILDNHFRAAMETLGFPEQDLAFRAFDYLVSPQGTKIAYPLDALAKSLFGRAENVGYPLIRHLVGLERALHRLLVRWATRIQARPSLPERLLRCVARWLRDHNPEIARGLRRVAARLHGRRRPLYRLLTGIARGYQYWDRNFSAFTQSPKSHLKQTLDRLQDAAILRREQRQEQLWYELYHDNLAGHVRDWRQAYKARQWARALGWQLRQIVRILPLLLTLLLPLYLLLFLLLLPVLLP